jgi:hypothetical protein
VRAGQFAIRAGQSDVHAGQSAVIPGQADVRAGQADVRTGRTEVVASEVKPFGKVSPLTFYTIFFLIKKDSLFQLKAITLNIKFYFANFGVLVCLPLLTVTQIGKALCLPKKITAISI